MTGDVREATDLVAQPNGGKLRRGDWRVSDPNPVTNAARANRYVDKGMAGIARIMTNTADRRSSGKSKAKKASRKGKYSVAQRLAAYRALLETARLDRTIRMAAVDEFISGIVEDVRKMLPPDQAEQLLAAFRKRAQGLG